MATREKAADIDHQGYVNAVMGYSTPYGPETYPGKKNGNGFLSEDHFQIEAFQWVWKGYVPMRRTFFHPANEGDKNVVKANRDFSKGMLAGAYDFIFLAPSFVIELKQPGYWLNANQQKFQAAMRANGIPEYVCYYMEEFQTIVSEQFRKLGLEWVEPERMF